jgi:riboflavin synthase
MFTGLIEDIGTVKAVSRSKISITTKLDDIKIGDSVAVNGVCLTARQINGRELSFDYSPQTAQTTALSVLRAGSRVNIERALKLISRLGGHIVSGHIDGISKIVSIARLENFYKFTFLLGEAFSKYIVSKGSVAVDGISLTTAEVNKNDFSAYIIPATFQNTALAFLKQGDSANIEADVMAKYAEKLLGRESGISGNFLKDNGFIL